MDVSPTLSHFVGLWQPRLGLRSRFIQLVPGFGVLKKMKVGILHSPRTLEKGRA